MAYKVENVFKCNLVCAFNERCIFIGDTSFYFLRERIPGNEEIVFDAGLPSLCHEVKKILYNAGKGG